MSVSRLGALPAARLAVLAVCAIWVGAGTGCSFQPHGATGTGTMGADGGWTSGGDAPMRNLDMGFINGDGGAGAGDGAVCLQVVQAVVRDFRGSPGPNGEPKHPDFEYVTGPDLKGIAAAMIGPNSKPAYGPTGPTAVTHGAAEYDQWYRDVADVNMRFDLQIPLAADPANAGTFIYDNSDFFPLDNMGFGNEGRNHNFHFTTEMHFDFPYRGGEVFTFKGDDDVWLFVNGRLAIDLGGVHGVMTGSVNLDQAAATLGITPGGTYRMDIFHAERHTTRSNFRIETTLACINNVVIP
ncbi:MAG: fibro-slime domain-containing protein [Bacteroidota bacterium]